MLETHPFGNFVPKSAKHLLLGSFCGQPEPGYDWFYSNRRNQFWKIIEAVYKTKLPDRKSKEKLFSKLGLAVGDVIKSCERKRKDNADTSLTNITYNTHFLKKLLKGRKIKKIYFSSKFVEDKFKKLFKNTSQEIVTLPSPSPRYAKLRLEEKVKIYRKVLPRLS